MSPSRHPDYFETMSIPLREGRLLEDRLTANAAPPVAVVTDSLKRREWPAESPVGQRIRIQWQGQPREAEIVGVVGADSPRRARQRAAG